MFAMQYSHRLPADYDMQIIRERAARRGPLWDDTEGLAFKAFVSRERGRHGAAGHVYASVYLWLDASAATRFLMGDRFQAVIDSFGRPRVETWLPLDARAGTDHARKATWLLREERALDAGADRAALHAAEVEANRQRAAGAGIVAVWTALDLDAWRLVRFTLSAHEPGTTDGSTLYEVLHLARPGIGALA
ncbi:DUF4865 family protein [Variovorax sp. W6]|uniref:DUF4865 family protein n=1 Tax=Variovorax sp. W6 TaxID=3093895 RepID=UPI003D800343